MGPTPAPWPSTVQHYVEEEAMKKYTRKPTLAYKWDGVPDDHVQLVGHVRGDAPCKGCGKLLEVHGQLQNPRDSAISIFCEGYWVLIDDDSVTEYVDPERFEQQYEEAK
jgi:hypothetical protein